MHHSNLYLLLPSPEALAPLVREALPGYAVTGDERMGPLVATRKKFFSRKEISFSFKNRSTHAAEVRKHLEGMYSFFASLETEHKETRTTLLAHIRLFTTMVAVDSKQDLDDETVGAIMSICESCGLFFYENGLFMANGDLVMDLNGDSNVQEYTVKAPAALLDQHTNASLNGEARKQRTNALLEELGIPVCESLPPTVSEAHVRLRSSREIAERMLGMVVTSIYAEHLRDSDLATSRERIAAIMAEYDAGRFLTPEEQAFLRDDTPAEEDIFRFIWRYECYWVGLWALGYLEDIGFPDDICDVRYMVSFMRESGGLEAFSENARLRRAQEILDEADFIYRCDWACVDARINGEEPPGSLNPGVVVERHRMLNWMTRYMDQEWDDVCTDT